MVEALRSDWSLDPFHSTEKDAIFTGGGTVDDKAAAACWIANLILYKQEGYRPDRDIIVALTAEKRAAASITASMGSSKIIVTGSMQRWL